MPESADTKIDLTRTEAYRQGMIAAVHAAEDWILNNSGSYMLSRFYHEVSRPILCLNPKKERNHIDA